MNSRTIAIIGASGYTGVELIRVALGHPHLKIVSLIADRNAGKFISEIYPSLASFNLPQLARMDEFDPGSVDLIFCALPHTTSQRVIKGLFGSTLLVDLSADFRLRDPAEYERWYGHIHVAPSIQKEATYGLTEFYREKIRSSRLVACTGCNAASGLYPLVPLVEEKAIDLQDITLDLKAGVSGAGRVAKPSTIFAELSEGCQPYNPVWHRHLAEFDQELGSRSDTPVKVSFTPHLIPQNRGILTTIYVKGNPDTIHQILSQRYASERFIHVQPMETPVSTRHVRGSNLVHISVFPDRINGRCKIFSVLDNLTKGSSGQAIQNANLMLGLPEMEGLQLVPLVP